MERERTWAEPRSVRSSQLRMPMQAAPIERTPVGAREVNDGGVEPSFWGTLIPIAASVLSNVLK